MHLKIYWLTDAMSPIRLVKHVGPYSMIQFVAVPVSVHEKSTEDDVKFEVINPNIYKVVGNFMSVSATAQTLFSHRFHKFLPVRHSMG